MHIAAVQLDIAWEDPGANCARVERLLGAGLASGSLIALPEMFASGFSMNLDRATRDLERTIEFLQQLARKHGCHVVAGLARRDESGRATNDALVVAADGSIAASYTKLHPFTLGGERDCYQPGAGIVTFRWQQFTAAPFICYDLRFPEICRQATRQGADLFIVIANWPIARVEHWITLLRARAIENQAYVLGVNRCGRDPGYLYPGRSMLVDPMGVVRADAGDREGVLIGDVNFELVREVRTKLPFLADIRDDFLPRRNQP